MVTLIRNVFWISLVCVEIEFSFGAGKGGRTATKVGLAGISQVGIGSLDRDSDSNDPLSAVGHEMSSETNGSATKLLKKALFGNKRYDKAIRPVINNSDAVNVYVDLTYMQVLNLNEKEQTLKSLIRYRLYWEDQFLTWIPSMFDGIEEIWLPSSDIWIPDIVCYEGTGTRDFTPRIPYVVVNHKGRVRYLEPTEYDTTCHVSISYFPFDSQTCSLTFTAWTFPTSKVDLMAKRDGPSVREDIPTYFADSGEWQLLYINVTKTSQNFDNVLPDSKENLSTIAGGPGLASTQFFEIDPLLRVRDVNPYRVTTAHWSNVKFSLTFRRNSSLYIQSMLFPAILLTTISLLGFYLPPDSGERIGLQITILLTFMVFILTVGDMFPASTGPYLGVYFVLCMALLGLNIIMTVLVLYLHYMPINLILDTNLTTGTSKCDLRHIPLWIKGALFVSGIYNNVRRFTITADGSTEKGSSEGGCFDSLRTRLRNRRRENCGKLDCFHTVSRNGAPGVANLAFASDTNGIKSTNNVTTFSQEVKSAGRGLHPDTRGLNPATAYQSAVGDLHREVIEELRGVAKKVKELVEVAGEHRERVKLEGVEGAMEEKWRWVARKVDVVCLRFYIACLMLFHAGIILAVMFDG